MIVRVVKMEICQVGCPEDRVQSNEMKEVQPGDGWFDLAAREFAWYPELKTIVFLNRDLSAVAVSRVEG